MAIKVGINGFGRIGRLVFRVLMERDNFEVVAVNDLADAKSLAYLLKYDTVHGRYPGEVSAEGENLVVDGKKVPVLSVKNPKELPWKKLGVFFAVESTGVFRDRTSPKGGYGDHLEAGAKKVLLTVPAKDKVDATIVLGVNDDMLKAEHKCISNASCTTNCLAPVAKVLHDEFGVLRGLITTCHGYTNDQVCCDQIHKDPARGRAAAMKAAAEGPLKGILAYVEDPIVSSDVIHDSHSSIFAARETMVIESMVKVISWYDNEWGYSNRVVDLMQKAAAL